MGCRLPLLLAAIASGCSSSGGVAADGGAGDLASGGAADLAAPMTTVTFTPSSGADVPNPERGFFDQVDLVAGGDFSFVRTEGFTLAYAPVRLDAYRASS